MSQDAIVANFTSLTTTDADEMVATLLSYHKSLSDGLFDVATLDDDHRSEVRVLSKTSLIKLRQRLEALVVAVRNATMAPDI